MGGGSYGTDDKNVRMGRAADRAQFPPIASVAVRVSLHSVTMWRGLVNATMANLCSVTQVRVGTRIRMTTLVILRLSRADRRSSRTIDVSNKMTLPILLTA